MDLQFFGANCTTISCKGVRIIIDDNLADLGAKSIARPEDVALFTFSPHASVPARITFDGPGEYEVADISIVGMTARSHLDPDNTSTSTTMYKLVAGDVNVLITGHIHPNINDTLLERIGMVDVLIIPVGGSGYTLDPIGALKVIKEIEPKLIIPTHYADAAINYPVPQVELEHALKEMAIEPKERVSKLRLKASEFSDISQLIVLERS